MHKVFPSAVKTFTPHDGRHDDEHKDKKTEGPADTEMTIDLTQLIYTQLAVTQDVIKANEGQAKTIRELRKANDALRGRVARLEESRGTDQTAPGEWRPYSSIVQTPRERLSLSLSLCVCVCVRVCGREGRQGGKRRQGRRFTLDPSQQRQQRVTEGWLCSHV